MTKHKAKHSVRKKAKAAEQGQAKHEVVTPQVRYLAWRKNVGVAGPAPTNQSAFNATPLSIDTFHALPKEFEDVKVEIFDKADDAKPLVTINGAESDGMFMASRVTNHKPEGVPDKDHSLHARFFVLGTVDAKLLYVPLKGHKDFPDESWDIYLKVTANGTVVQNDKEVDCAHLWVDWPEGAVVFPMLGAPAIVDAKKKWLECLVATQTPLHKGAEKFFLLSQLRLYKWGDGKDASADEKVRQKALLKRTFDLYDDSIVEFAHYTFDQLSTDEDKDKDSSFTMKLGYLQHWTRADLEYANDIGRKQAKEAHIPYKELTAGDAPVGIPALGLDDPSRASNVHLYKVRLKLKEGTGLYDLVWMNRSDFHQANRVAAQWKNKKGKLKEKVHLSQDARLREALHMLISGTRLAHVPTDAQEESANAQKEDDPLYGPLHHSWVAYKQDGNAQEPNDHWKPSRNLLESPSDLHGFRSYHPVSVASGDRFKNVGHLTDLHLDTRLDVMAQVHTVDGKDPLQLIPGSAPPEIQSLPLADLLNNYNATFHDLADKMLGGDADVLLLTGDLTDYNRGFAAMPENGKSFEARETWRTLGGDDEFKAYKTGRNWALVYAHMVRLYTKHKKPIFTILGNHDYRPKPYGLFPGKFGVHPYDTIAGDLNLTIYESIALYGNAYGGIRGAEIGATILYADLKKMGLLDTEPDSPRWYDYAINGWKDFYAFLGDQALLFLDWDVEEDNLEWKGFHLPRAQRFMTKPQRAIYDRLVDKAPKPWRVLVTHATLVCNNPKVGVQTNAAARAADGVDLGKLTWGTMGASNWHGRTDSDEASSIRHLIAGHVADKTLRLTLSGHSHMDGVYKVLSGGKKVQMLWPEPKDQPSWAPGDAVPPGGKGSHLEMKDPPANVDQCAVVTNSGGPCGEYVEKEWTRRSRPSGNVFTFDGSAITMKNLPSERLSAIPRRCVHDAERERIEHDAFIVVDYPISWTTGSNRMDDLDQMMSGYFVFALDKDEPKLNGLQDLYLAVHSREPDQWFYERSNLVGETHDSVKKTWRQKVWFAFTKRHIERTFHARHTASTANPFEIFMVLRYPGGDKRQDWVMSVKTSWVVYDGRAEYDQALGRIKTRQMFKVHWEIQKEVEFDGDNPRWRTK